MPANLENSAVAQDWKRSDFLDHRKRKRVPESIYFYFIDYAKDFACVDDKKLWKILQARLQQYVNQELPDVQAGFRKVRGIKLPTSVGSSKKK